MPIYIKSYTVAPKMYHGNVSTALYNWDSVGSLKLTLIGSNMSGIGLNLVDKISRIVPRAHRLDADPKRAASFAQLNRQCGFAMEPAEAAKLILDRIGREVACHTLLFVFTH
jgi:hypothetical protein